MKMDNAATDPEMDQRAYECDTFPGGGAGGLGRRTVLTGLASAVVVVAAGRGGGRTLRRRPARAGRASVAMSRRPAGHRGGQATSIDLTSRAVARFGGGR